MASEDGCLFCRIVAGDVPAEIVKIGERVVAFRDVNPQAPLHTLVVPRDHHEDVAALAAADPQALAELVDVARGLATAHARRRSGASSGLAGIMEFGARGRAGPDVHERRVAGSQPT